MAKTTYADAWAKLDESDRLYLDRIGQCYLEAPDDEEEEQALEDAHTLACERLEIDGDDHLMHLSDRLGLADEDDDDADHIDDGDEVP